jgi:hypothetical protein
LHRTFVISKFSGPRHLAYPMARLQMKSLDTARKRAG